MRPAHDHTDDIPPSIALQRMLAGAWISSAIALASKLGVADLLADGPKALDELAEATSSHPPSLFRLLRALASVGIFQEAEDGRFILTPLAEPLQSVIPGSLRAFAIMLGEEWHWQAWGRLGHSVQTGESAFEQLQGMTVFDYWTQHPAAGAIFDAAMTSRGAEEERAVLAAYDFSGITTLADIGGGHGSFLTALLQACPQVHGLLFDLPNVIVGARARIEMAGLQERCRVVAGSFFESVPGGADAYILKKVIHDWDDERAATILRHCCRALPETGRLLLVELVVPPGNEPSFAKLLDLLMLVWTPGGKERSAAEHETLLASAGFELTRIVPTASAVSVIEAVRR